MSFKSIVNLLANRINQPKYIEYYLLLVWNTAIKQCKDNERTYLDALEKIIEMNRQTALHKYGDSEKAESWGCVIVARESIKSVTNNSTIIE